MHLLDHPTDFWRFGNAVISVIGFVWLAIDLKARHNSLTKRRVYLHISLLGFLLAMFIGSIETIVTHDPIGVRTALVTASCLWTLIGLRLGHDEEDDIHYYRPSRSKL